MGQSEKGRPHHVGEVTHLKADNVAIEFNNAVENLLFPVRPIKCPRRSITVHRRSRILLAENIVTEDVEAGGV